MSQGLTSATDMLKAAWAAFTKRWKFFVLLTIVAGIIPGIVFFIGGAIAAAVGLGSVAGGAGKIGVIIAGALLLVAYIAAIYVSICFYAGLMLSVSNESINTVRLAYNAGKPKAKDLFIVGLLAGIIIVIGFILLIVPGIYLSVCYAFAMWFCLLEGKKGMDALKDSKAMVTGRWMPVAIRLAVFAIAAWLVAAIPAGLFGAIRLPVLAAIWQGCVSLITGPIGVIYSYMLYQNLKQNKVAAPVTPVAPAQA